MSNGNGSVAPHCPISHSQDPTNPRGTAPTRLPAIPIATDLPSLIRSVNIMRDILRNITTSLTVNNTYLPRAPRQPKVWGDRTYIIAPYPDWYQVAFENVSGFVGKDKKARTHVERLNSVVFRNNERDDDNLFKWLYKLPLTGRGGGSEPFEEDFFERVLSVKWKPKEDEPPEYEFTDRIIISPSIIAASYWDSQLINGQWFGITCKLASSGEEATKSFLARASQHLYPPRPVTLVGFSHVNREWDVMMPFNPPGGPQVLTVSGVGSTTATIETHDAVYGQGTSDSINFGTVIRHAYTPTGLMEFIGPQPEITYKCDGIKWIKYVEGGAPYHVLVGVQFTGKITAWPGNPDWPKPRPKPKP